ncbi:MarR family transcriptional regulator [Paenibacillus sp. MMS20-IR301]|uniref:MarR family winged helix-turn-helix transcriptional regulator n=1 Tax=Paenibacillus sp. MMS20-IR301 TaxID=2895946 RepID=UPI0028E99E68|nr:MarR family transcriptional regulator [Paenibacillus sp. MMS20-IR301]WNS42551.1 MarR family transcriptional regulator [Paenibacillus sp. MMS20-IR301]
MTQEINPLIERVGLSMWKVQRKIMSQMSMHKEMGLTVPQFGLLHMIAQEKQARVIHLADKLEVKSSAVTVMLDRLELLELIARVPDENDRRAVIVTITGKGQGILEEAQRRSMELLQEHLAILEPEELQNFADYYTLLEKQER